MGVRAPRAEDVVFEAAAIGPPVEAALAVGALVLALLVSNGRPIPEGHLGYLGKAISSLASAASAALFFAATGRAHGEGRARACTLLFSFGTTVWAVSESWSLQPLGLLALSASLLLILKGGDDKKWAGRAGLPLGLAAAVWPAHFGAAVALGLGIAFRWPARLLFALAWAVPGVGLGLLLRASCGRSLPTGLEGLGEAVGVGHLGLLTSPGKGLFVFTPLVLVGFIGMGRAWRAGERWLVATFSAAFWAEWALVGASPAWHGSPGFGPVSLTGVLPFVLLFLPEGLETLPRIGALMAVFSVGVQLLGAFSADLSWEQCFQRTPGRGHEELWRAEDSPLTFYLERRLVILAMPGLVGGHLRAREYPFVVAGHLGSRFGFSRDAVVVGGAEENAGDVHLLGGARVEGQRLRLGPGDGVFLRALPGARLRPLEIRVAGSGSGVLALEEGSFWSPPRGTSYPVAGSFRLRHPYVFTESGGSDLTVVLKTGSAFLDGVALVSPRDPESPLELR